MTGSVKKMALLAALLALPCAAHAQDQQLGGQRRGTASLEFLKIGVGARAEAMGEAFVSVANDPSAMYWNPAGVASLQRRSAQISTTQYPADIRYNHLSVVFPSEALDGSIGIQIGGLASDMPETDEFHPYGTGRTFTFTDFVMGATYARRFTDKLLIGFGMKFAREDYGSQLDAPVTQALLFDIGSIYYIGFRSLRVGMSLTNFGGDVGPRGSFVSSNGSGTRSYDTFTAPTTFRYGVGFEPLERENLRVTAALEATQPSDNRIEYRVGTEVLFQGHLALRSGYQIRSDAFKFSAGAGFKGEISSLAGEVDYAYTDGGPLGHVNRLSLQVAF